MTTIIYLTGRESLRDLLTITEDIRDTAWSKEQLESARRTDELALEQYDKMTGYRYCYNRN
jgi:hypothetical protein